jgi:hypothetical protein
MAGYRVNFTFNISLNSTGFTSNGCQESSFQFILTMNHLEWFEIFMEVKYKHGYKFCMECFLYNESVPVQTVLGEGWSRLGDVPD